MPKPSLSAGLPAPSSTLVIPLAARAHAARLCPGLAPHDAAAQRTLDALQLDVTPYLDDRASIYGILERNARLVERGRAFVERHPRSLGVNLGCGLSHYFQWLDQAGNHWLDVDLPPVIALRREALAADACPRRRELACDLTAPGWWMRLGLPTRHEAASEPVLLMSEGVLMYLAPAQVHALLLEFAEQAPAGSRLMFDAVSWLAVGQARLHPSVRYTGAEFRWGLRRVAELGALHARLALHSEQPLMESYGWPYSMLGPSLRWFTGAPFYGLYSLEAHD